MCVAINVPWSVLVFCVLDWSVRVSDPVVCPGLVCAVLVTRVSDPVICPDLVCTGLVSPGLVCTGLVSPGLVCTGLI